MEEGLSRNEEMVGLPYYIEVFKEILHYAA